MLLLLIRHAIAEDRDEFATTGLPDEDRPLTAFGKRRMRRTAQGLRRVAPRLEVLASSPLVRAQQTARILAAEYRMRDVIAVDALTPGKKPRDLMSWLARQPAEGTIAVVGHEPHLGTLLTWCMTGRHAPAVTIKKGGAALLDFAGPPAGGGATLQWLLTPSQLRALGE